MTKEKNTENFKDNTSNCTLTSCLDGPWLNGNPSPYAFSPYGRLTVNFPYGSEKVGDNCYCRAGLSMGKLDPNDDTCNCVDKDGRAVGSQYWARNNQGNNIYGLDTAKIGDDCLSDTDCGQIRINQTSQHGFPGVDYLSNLRCSSPSFSSNDPPVKGKCEDISTLYGIIQTTPTTP